MTTEQLCEHARALLELDRPSSKEITAVLMRATADALEDSVRAMRKRVWIYYGEDEHVSELPDGAVPCGWLKEEARRIRAEADKLERDD